MAEPGTTILHDETLELGEGPRFHAATGTLFWFDIIGRALFEHRLAEATTRRHALPVMASEIGWLADGRQVIAGEAGLYLRDAATGATALHIPIEDDRPANRSNDGGIHPSGALWIGTMGRKAETGVGAIYHVRRGVVTKLFSGISIPNAICFTEDGRTACFTDSAEDVLRVVALDPATGLPKGAPEVLVDHSGAEGDIDGAVIDRDGLVWAAIWGGGRVDAFSPSGERVRSLPVPARQPTCPAFVGANADRLVVTSAWEGMDRQGRAADPQAGRTFLLDISVRGFLAPPLDLG